VQSQLYPNLGLEFGAYRQYLENHWDGESDVLFCHDDADGSSEVAVRQGTTMKALEEISTLNSLGVDHAYIFHDEYDEFVNGGAHGRAMWIRGSLLQELAKDFPADMENTGTNIGVTAQRGILMFHERIKAMTPNTAVCAIVPQLRFGHRGRIHDEMFVYRKTDGKAPGGIVNVA
jgi:hypothetical protein